MAKRKHKLSYLGPAFHQCLEHLEGTEACYLTGDHRALGKEPIRINERFFRLPSTEASRDQIGLELFRVDAVLAPIVRSSIKYRVASDTLVEVAHRHTDRLNEINETHALHLPHQWSTIIIDHQPVSETTILIAQQQTVENDQAYPELGLEPNEPFLCINVFSHITQIERDDGTMVNIKQLFHWPVEIHAQLGLPEREAKVLYAGANNISPTDEGSEQLELIWRAFVIWMQQFHIKGLMRSEVIDGARVPEGWRPHHRSRPRKKHEHPLFEHMVLTHEIDAPDPEATGGHKNQPPKRLHHVRGFWRHYKKSGKRVWVQPHWRGNEQLGVVRRDIELVPHAESPHDVQDDRQHDDPGQAV